jgi:hypothetical protein
MTFPAKATNGQVTVVNGITYIFSASTTSWSRVPTIISNIGNLSSQNTLNIGGNIGANITTPRATLDLGNATDMMLLPSGSTSQRPINPVNGAIRYNTCIGAPEYYNSNSAVFSTSTGTQIIYQTTTIYSSGWYPFYSGDSTSATVLVQYPINYLLIAGGGGGGGGFGGGGGGGGYVSGSTTVTAGTQIAVTVGSGGPGGTEGSVAGLATSGTSSVLGTIASALGGGGGGGWTGSDSYPNNNPPNVGRSGGSGGGDSSKGSTTSVGANGQGYGGGTGGSNNSSYDYPGGGGGAGGAGANLTAGKGLGSNITGATVYYAGGGGGYGTTGFNGKCGGGNGVSGTGTAGGTNVGGGGGGGTTAGGTGGSGIVVVAYASPTQLGTGGCTVTSYCNSGSLTWVHTFKNSGTYKA